MRRAYLYGDLLFETILASGGKIPHILRHYKRLAHGAQALKFDLCGLNEEKFVEVLEHELGEFLLKNPHSKAQRMRFVLYRTAEGLYLPQNHETQFEVEIANFEISNEYKAIKGAVYLEQQKAPGPLSNLKTGNALIYVMAKIWAQENELEDALITNTSEEIIEASSSNIFWHKNNHWFTPPLNAGCIAGIGRELFMEQVEVQEKKCMYTDLLQADKIILTNALVPQRPFLLAEKQFIKE